MAEETDYERFVGRYSVVLEEFEQRVGSISFRRVTTEANVFAEAVRTIGSNARSTGGALGGLVSVATQIAPIAESLGVGIVQVGLALADFVGGTIAAGGALVNLSSKTGISTDELQRMQAVATQTGTSMETFTGAVAVLSTNIASKSREASDAIWNLGLSYTNLAEASRGEQFSGVIKALAEMDDVSRRHAAGAALFGKEWPAIAAAIEGGYVRIAEAARTTGREQLEALSEADRALKELQADAEAGVTGWIANVALVIQEARNGFRSLTAEQKALGIKFVAASRMGGIDGLNRAGEFIGAVRAANRRQEQERANRRATPKPENPFGELESSTRAATELTSQYSSVATAQVGVERGIKSIVEGMARAAESTTKYGDALAATVAPAAQLEQSQTRQLKTTGALDTASAQFAADQDRLFGRDLVNRANYYADLLGSVGQISRLSSEQQDELNKIVTDGIAASIRLYDQVPPRLLAIQKATQAAIDARMLPSTFDPFAAENSGLWALREPVLPNRPPPDAYLESAPNRDFPGFAGGIESQNLAAGVAKLEELKNAAISAAFDGFGKLFAQLGKLPGVLGTVMTGLGGVAGGLQEAHKWSTTLGKDEKTALGGRFGSLSVAFNKDATAAQRVSAGMSAATSVAQGAMDVWGATDNHRSALGNAGAGALAGAKAGAFAGPWGIAVGAAAGFVVGLIRGKPAWAKAADEVGRDFGVKISKGLSEEIAKLAKSDFKGSRQAASIFKLSDIIKEDGGLSDKNVGKMTDKLRDVFVMLETGAFSSAQATKVLEENFAQFAEVATSSTGLISPKLAEIRDLAKNAGLEVGAISEFVSQQVGAAAKGMEGFFAPTQAAIDGLAQNKEKLAELNAELAKAGDDPERQKELQVQIQAVTQAMSDQQGVIDALSIKTAEGAAAAGASIAGLFAEFQTQGNTVLESLALVQPAAESLGAQLAAAGLSGGEAFDTINRYALLANDAVAGPVLGAVESLNQGLVGLNNAGLLNQETFSGLTGQVSQAFNSLVAQGHDGNDVLALMQPTLQTIAELQSQFGFQTDESTQALMDQAREAGLLGNVFKSDTDKMLSGMTGLTEALDRVAKGLGQDVPASAEAAANAMGDAAGRMTTDLAAVDSAVNGVNFGHSPGGLKEIPIQLGVATDAMSAFRGAAVGDLGAVYEGIQQLGGEGTFDGLTSGASLVAEGLAGPVHSAVDGVREGLEAVNAAGTANESMFGGLAAQATQALSEVAAQGATGDAALGQMETTIQALAALQQEFGATTDVSTQALDAQLQQSGRLGEAVTTDSAAMLIGMQKFGAGLDGVAEGLGKDVPAEAENAARAVAVASQRMINDLEGVDNSIDGINFGHSPGGLKEIPIQLDYATDAMRSFSTMSLQQLDSLYGGLDGLIAAVGEFNGQLKLERMGAISPENQAAIDKLQDDIKAQQDASTAAGKPLEKMKADLEALNESIDKAGTKADKRVLETEKKLLEEAIKKEEDSLKALRDSIDKQIDELEARIEKLKSAKNPLEGFALTPEMIGIPEAIEQVNRVFQAYGGRNATSGELASIGSALSGSITADGRISLDILNDFLKKMVDTHLGAIYNPGSRPGLANGTMGQYGEWFKDWKGGTAVTLHHEEAVVNRRQARAFAEDVLGEGPRRPAFDEDRLAARLGGVLAGVVAEERYKSALALRDANNGAL